MTRLLRANFFRLWTGKLFWICFALTAGDGLLRFFLSYYGNGGRVERLGGMLVAGGADIMFIASIFSVLYLGTEYSNGTLRNKLIVGRRRTEIYFANLLTVLIVTFIYAAEDWLVTLAAGLITDSKFGMSADEFMMCTAVYVCAFVALCAVNVLIGILITVKSSAVVVTLVLMLGTIMISETIISYLRIPQYVSYWEMTETGTVQQVITEEENPAYIRGTQRIVYTFLNNIIPCGPVCWIEDGKLPEDGETLPLYSLGSAAALTAVGAAVFRKKDLK